MKRIVFASIFMALAMCFASCERNTPDDGQTSGGSNKKKEYYVKYVFELSSGSPTSGYVTYTTETGFNSTHYLYNYEMKKWEQVVGPVEKGFNATFRFSLSPYAAKGIGSIYVREGSGGYMKKTYRSASNSDYLYITVN